MNFTDAHRGLRLGRHWQPLVALGAVLVLGACDGLDDLLEVEAASKIPASQLEQPGNASLLVTSAVADFECAFGSYTVIGGLIGEELVDATQTADRYPYDMRQVTPDDRRYAVRDCENLGVYTPLQTARFSADKVLRSLQGWTDQQVPNRSSLVATAATYAGYSLVLLGEGFCSTVISTIDEDGDFVYGDEITREQALQEAVERFTIAVQAAETAGNEEMLYTALVGRARALLSLGRYADASADAARVPESFTSFVTASEASTRRRNRVWDQSSETRESVTFGEPYLGMDDPRVPIVPVIDPSTGRQRVTTTGVPLYRQTKYTSANSPILLASGKEAEFIIAEADARAGGAGGLASAISTINEYRQRAGQAPFTGTTQEAVLAELFEQRRREFFLDSHHLGDVIRFGVDLSPAPGTAYHGGGQYGNSTCLPLPNVERLNNPNLQS